MSSREPISRVIPKYYQLRSALLEELGSGRFQPGDRFYSLNELMGRFRLSSVTIHKALDMLVEEGLLTAEQGRGTFVAALPDASRHLTVTEGGFLGLLIGNVDSTTPLAMQKILAGIEAEAGEHGYQLQVATISEDAGKLPRMLEQALVRGIVVMGDISAEVAERVKRFPAVLFGHGTPYGLSYVRSNAVQAGREVGKYLLRLGHERVALIAGETTPVLVAEEIGTGLRQAFESAGRFLSPELVAVDGRQSEAVLTAQVLSAAPTALFIGPWLGALGVLQVLRERGLCVPADVSVVGWGDNVLTLHCDPPLTAVKLFTEECAREATRTLLKLIRGATESPCAAYCPVAIIERGSCRPIGPSLLPDRAA